jgi:chemotaxis protein MotB
MSDEKEPAKTEIVIVRRRSADDGAAGKGGAWKIAYADFVTAMMAFFLVMWLINASNEETRSQVASYFNPIKLTDTSTGARSLKDMKDSRSPENSEQGDSAEGTAPSKTDVTSEAEAMANPPASLDIVAETESETLLKGGGLQSDAEIAPSLQPSKTNPGVGDPFDPKAWEKAKGMPAAGAEAKHKPDTGTSAEEKKSENASGEDAKKAENTEPTSLAAAGEKQRQAAETAAATIAKQIAERLGGDAERLGPSLEVKATPDGLLISLTEHETLEMFETGSARPTSDALKLVEAVAATVASRQGYLVVRGHTDSRPFRNKYYDNWQLSTARAHFARYMLLRSGLPEDRIRKIEGVADREPRNSEDPQAPENRRIEILLGTETP